MKLTLVLLISVLTGFAATDTEKRVQAAATVLQEIMETSDRSIPQDLLNKAECAVVVPGMKQGAFIVGAKFGRGFVSCRTGNAGWSAPAAIRIEGGSVGFQIGGTETDIIMLVLNRSGAEKLMSSKFTVGADATVAAGPVGRTTGAETDAYLRAEILSWSRSRGAFAGIALKGSTLRPDEKSNQELYGKELTTRAVVMDGTPVNEAGQPLVSALTKYSARK
ncbi:MAG: lipid-binding SYLF domain-containing protein [Bryobacteraceae bacterium]|nr:lipid-binding SYLF domain-containing protein [Bryobacteraceae bacterium]